MSTAFTVDFQKMADGALHPVIYPLPLKMLMRYKKRKKVNSTKQGGGGFQIWGQRAKGNMLIAVTVQETAVGIGIHTRESEGRCISYWPE